MSILEVDIIIVHLFFLIFHFLGTKFEIRLKYFLDKNLQKQPLCIWIGGQQKYRSKSNNRWETTVRKQ